MDANMNGPLPPEKPGDEELPLLPVSPALNRRRRAQHLSQLSLQSVGSQICVSLVDAIHDETVGIETRLHGEFFGD